MVRLGFNSQSLDSVVDLYTMLERVFVYYYSIVARMFSGKAEE
jgi:hypothetical protein